MDLPPAPIGSWPTPMGSWSPDAEWVERTFTHAFESERPALLRWLVGRMRDEAAAEDCCQEAFARLLCELRNGRCPDVPGAWLHQVARNLLISRARHAQVVARGERYAAPAVSGDPTAGAILGREQFQAVRLALETMPCGERDLLLRAARGQTGAQLADRLGVSQVAVRTRLFRARRRLRTMIESRPAYALGAGPVSSQP
jgi:RNA polymerase sigma factor (sigma-70 family)